MINIYATFALSASMICSLLAVMVYFTNRKSTLNRVFIHTIAFGAYLAFTTFMLIQTDSAENAILWNKIGFLWPFFLALLLQFVLVFTGNRLSTDKRRFVILYLPALLFSLIDLTTIQLSGMPVNTPWGYTFRGTDSLMSAINNLWVAALSCISIILCLRYYLKVKDDNKKQQAKLITIGLSYPVIVSTLSKVATILFGWYIPYYGVGANAILCIFAVYAIWKFDIFNLNPAMAAENIIATMPDSFILTDSNGKILRANPALTNLAGYKEDELRGQSISQLLTSEHGKQLIDDITQKQEIKSYETQMITKASTQKPVTISTSLIKSNKDKVIGTTLIIHDLTRRKRNEEKIIQNERFAAIGELAGMVAHDLRNPLNSIQVATYYLKKKCAKDMSDTSIEMLESIQTSIQYSNKIINDLLDYSREIKLKIEETSPKAAIANALALAPAPENIKVIDLTQDLPTLRVDRVSMSRVFVNTIKNAFEAMPNGGTLTIRSTQTQNNVEISFEDTGVGMTKETVDKLGTPLFTTKAKGMGFGLPICKRIVEAHGGQIKVKSVPEEGTVFSIIISLKPADNFRKPQSAILSETQRIKM